MDKISDQGSFSQSTLVKRRLRENFGTELNQRLVHILKIVMNCFQIIGKNILET